LARITGKVKWFNNSKGYGFIERPDSQDIFVHYSAILADGFKTLEEGEEVEFEVKPAPHGPQAERITRLRREAVKPKSISRAVNVFLCHSKQNKAAVRNLYQRLRSENINPWFDEESLLPGQDWDYEIRKAVKSSDAVIVCVSKDSVSKAGYVQKEIKHALDIADLQPEGTIYLIPLKLEECDMPDKLSRWHWVNYFEENGYDQLMRALHSRAATL
jgi:cold shock CspA family protein